MSTSRIPSLHAVTMLSSSPPLAVVCSCGYLHLIFLNAHCWCWQQRVMGDCISIDGWYNNLHILGSTIVHIWLLVVSSTTLTAIWYMKTVREFS